MIHVIRLGTHAEKDYFLRATDWYDEILINANLLDGTASSTSYLAFSLGRRNKGFFVDPVTYAFALDPAYVMSQDAQGRWRFKRTFLSLAKQYGLIEQDSDQIHRLELSILKEDQAFQRSFCQSVLAYQQSKMRETLEADADFIADNIPTMVPTRLIAPYFYLSDDEWISVNADLAQTSTEIAREQLHSGVWALICFDGLLLDQKDVVDKISKRYGALPCDGYGLWLTDFDEQKATLSQIQGLARLVTSLKERNPDAGIIDMYGGYFAALLSSLGMDGISHGVGYGERRDIVPVVGGGPPQAKYYLPAIHEEIYIHELVPLTRNLSLQQFQDDICQCVICQGLLHTGVQGLLNQFLDTVRRISSKGGYRDYPSPTVHRLTRFHFMHNRHMELRQLLTSDLRQSAQSLAEAYERFGPELGHSRLMFLQTWRQALLGL
jgi:hypothetical protein